jgi:2-dehydropantoate 2-reductase
MTLLHKISREKTAVVMAVNGLPWWYFHGVDGPLEGTRLRAVDPDGAIWDGLGPQRVIGAVVYPAAEVDAPGLIRHVEGRRFSLGEPSGAKTERIAALSQEFIAAGLQAPVRDDIRSEIWLKLWGNLSFNPISALAHATLVDICQFPETRALAADMMREAEIIANKLGVTFKLGIERRIAGAEKVGAHKTSMLQDVEAGRPIELEALVGSIIELGRLTDTPTPHIGTVYALMRLLSQSLERAQGRLSIATA